MDGGHGLMLLTDRDIRTRLTAGYRQGEAMTAPQYATSTDLDVIAVIEANWRARREALAACRDWAKRFGADGFYRSSRNGIAALALDEKPTGHGRWVWFRRHSEPGKPRGVLPAAGNPLLDEMRALGVREEPVPGLADTYETALPLNDRRGDFMLFFPTPFVALGAAWIGFSMIPTHGEHGPQWREVKASEWHAAKEAFEAVGSHAPSSTTAPAATNSPDAAAPALGRP